MSFGTIKFHPQGSGRDLLSLRSVEHQFHGKNQSFLSWEKWGVGWWDEC